MASSANATHERVDVGGYHLHAWHSGAGRPAVLLDTGLGMAGALWGAVARDLAGFTQVYMLDRAGYGLSDPAPPGVARTAMQATDELRRIVERLGVPAPYVLAGHSLGGVHMQLYAQRFPADVAGLVLVDSSHPEQFSRLPGAGSDRRMRLSLRAFATLARLGLLRRVGAWQARRGLPGWQELPPDEWAALVDYTGRASSYQATLREAAALRPSLAQVRVAPGLLGDMPLAVLTAGDWAERPATPLSTTWLELQRELAALSSRGTHTIVPGCNHGSIVTVGRAAIVSALREIVESARGS